MFRELCARHQEIKIVLYSIWYRHTLYVAVWCTGWESTGWNAFQPVLSQHAHQTATYSV